MPGSFSSECCPPACDEVQSIQIPGPIGLTGDAGSDGTDGASSFTTFTVLYTIPAELGTAIATVADTSWMVVGQKVYGSRVDGSIHAFFQVAAISSPTLVTLKNLEDTPNNAYLENSAPATTLNIGSLLIPAGIQGPFVIPTSLGGSVWGNGAGAVEVPAGFDGHMLAYDSTDAQGIKSLAALPLTGGINVSTQRIARLSATTGLPIPIESSKALLNEPGVAAGAIGVLVLDASSGNARGTDAVELQVNRAAGVSRVASGVRSSIGGGQNNTAGGVDSVVDGGSGNSSSGSISSVGGGSGNTASGSQAVVAGGLNNSATAANSVVAGGSGNSATAATSVVGGGFINLSSGLFSTISGGQDNTSSGPNSTVGGGASNDATGASALVAGGSANLASGDYSSVCGGLDGVADKYGQVARANGRFANNGDAQVMELLWRNTTANATPTELFLDGASLQATIADGTSWVFRILIVARRSSGTTSTYESVGQISRVGATTAVAGVTTTELNDGIVLVPNPVVVDSDVVSEALRITVTGLASPASIRWVAHARIVQVVYP